MTGRGKVSCAEKYLVVSEWARSCRQVAEDAMPFANLTAEWQRGYFKTSATQATFVSGDKGSWS